MMDDRTMDDSVMMMMVVVAVVVTMMVVTMMTMTTMMITAWCTFKKLKHSGGPSRHAYVALNSSDDASEWPCACSA